MVRWDQAGRPVVNYLWNLLPDNDDTLKAWAKEFGVSAQNPFALLSKVGEDTAGAFQFVSDEWLTENVGNKGAIDWIDEKEVHDRLARLREERTWTARRPTDRGHFSLAGAQPKIALLNQEGRWGIPSGRIPTTHILKPPMPDHPGVIENQHACRRLASRLGMITAETAVQHFGDEIAIVVKRYDREIRKGGLYRLRQEDMCQALGVHPSKKYQTLGGPTIEQISRNVLKLTTDAKDANLRFFQAIAFNFLIGGTDAHGKNFSIVHLPGDRSYLAPLYDTISFYPYLQNPNDYQTLKMAMSVSKKYYFDDVMERHWAALANAMEVDADAALEVVRSYAERIPDEMAAVRNECHQSGLKHEILDKLVDAFSKRCTRATRSYKPVAVEPEVSSGPGRGF